MIQTQRALGLSLLMALAIGCGGAGGASVGLGSTTESTLLSTASEASLLELLAAGPELVPHEGVRYVEIFDFNAAGGTTTLRYREKVSINANGGFSLQPLTVESAVLPDEQTFLTMQEARAGYMFKYRDFRIRDLDQLLTNYHLLAVFAEPTMIAGRPVELLSFAHVNGDGPDYEVWVDSVTGLALSVETFDMAGTLVMRVAYESYVDGPPDAFTAHRGSNHEALADLGLPLAEQLGFEAPLAAIVPDGYQLHEVASVTDADGASWAKATYTDGIKVLFLLGGSPSSSTSEIGSAFVEIAGMNGMSTDRLLAFKAGQVSILHGRYGDQGRIAVGVEPLDELQAFLESSLPPIGS